MGRHLRAVQGVAASFAFVGAACSPSGGAGSACFFGADCAAGLLCADGLCASPPPGQGSVFVDPVTSLEWQADAPAMTMPWDSSVAYCAGLELEGRGWRVPTVEELRSLVRGCTASELGGACGATDACVTYDVCLTDCQGCETDAGPADGCYWPSGLSGACTWYWTSTRIEDTPSDAPGAWYIDFSYGHVCGRSLDFFGPVRCVRVP